MSDTDNKPMTDKEKVDCFIELHKEQLGKFKQTRDIEMKINITLWTLIVLGSYYINKEIPTTTPQERCSFLIWYIIIALVIAITHLVFWMRPIKKSEDTDDYYINKYRSEVEKLTGISIDKYPKYNKASQNWVFFEVGITLLLLILAGIYITVS